MDKDSKIRRKDPPPISFDSITPSKKNYYAISPNMYIHWLEGPAPDASDQYLGWRKRKINNPTLSLPYAERQLSKYNKHSFIFIGAVMTFKGKKQTFPNKTYTFHGKGEFKGEKRTVPVVQQEIEYHLVFYPKGHWKKIRNYHYPHKKFQGSPELFQSLLLTKSTMAKYGLKDLVTYSTHMDIRSFRFINVTTIPSFQSQSLTNPDELLEFLDSWKSLDTLIELVTEYAEWVEDHLQITKYQIENMFIDDYKSADPLVPSYHAASGNPVISEKLVNDYIDWLQKEETNPEIIKYYYIENRDKYIHMMKNLMLSVYISALQEYFNEIIYDMVE